MTLDNPFPLGARLTPTGARFAVCAPDATAVWVCLFDGPGVEHVRSERRVPLQRARFGHWAGEIDGVTAGQHYALRAAGPWQPGAGLRFNAHKTLLDPYARRIAGSVGDRDALYAYADDPFGPPSLVDSAGHLPLSVVCAPLTPPRPGPDVPWEHTVLYELHVGSFTARNPNIPSQLRGRYAALGHPAVIEHLTSLGVTAVELLPIHAMLTEPSVAARGMRNHWGYSTAAFFAPDPRFASRPGYERAEFIGAVDALHAAGIEVICDVVYNHTAEAGVAGPHLSLRGLDPRGAYNLDGGGRDIDYTGCGNTIAAASPQMIRLVTDSLRMWATDYAIDGFRFDLASVLGRGHGNFDAGAALLRAIETDPVLSTRKLIAEPWDATADGYRVGGFGGQWTEWNDRFRDTARRFWAGGGGLNELASRMCGSQDIFGGRSPLNSVNFVTAHDGFTLADVVSYERKHNEANGENGNDGTNSNHSVNHGVEGPAGDIIVRAERARHQRALLATLLFSAGVPMLLAGDEVGHSQRGNNNAYCVPAGTPAADAWAIDWANGDAGLLEFVRTLLSVRRRTPALSRSVFYSAEDPHAPSETLAWFDLHGGPMTAEAWHDPATVGVIAQVQGERPTLMVVIGDDGVEPVLPPGPWVQTFDSRTHDGHPAPGMDPTAGIRTYIGSHD